MTSITNPTDQSLNRRSDHELATHAHMISEMAGIVSRACDRIPGGAPLWAAVDTTAAIAYLRIAERLLNRAANRIDANDMPTAAERTIR